MAGTGGGDPNNQGYLPPGPGQAVGTTAAQRAAQQAYADGTVYAGGAGGGPVANYSGTGNTNALNALMQNPAFLAIARQAGINPTYNGAPVGPGGVANGGVGVRNVGGGVIYPAGSYGEYIQSGGTAAGWPAWQASHGGAGAPAATSTGTQQAAQAAYAQFRPPQPSAGQVAAHAASAQSQPFAGTLKLPPIKLSGIGAAPGAPAGAGGAGGAGALVGGGAAGGLAGSMGTPSWRPPSAVGLNPLDPNAATAIQEGQQNAAVAALQQYQQGLGASSLTRNLENQGAALAGSPGPIDPDLAQRMQSDLLESNAAATRDAENQAREAMGAQGRLGSGAAPVTFADIARQGGMARNQAMTQQRLGIAQANQQGRVANVGAATGALGTIGNLAGAAASRIADVYGGTQYDDQGLAKSLYGAMLGAGGGYGQGQAA